MQNASGWTMSLRLRGSIKGTPFLYSRGTELAGRFGDADMGHQTGKLFGCGTWGYGSCSFSWPRNVFSLTLPSCLGERALRPEKTFFFQPQHGAKTKDSLP